MWAKVVNTSGHEDPNSFPEYTGSLGVRNRSPKQGGIAHHDDAQETKRFFDWGVRNLRKRLLLGVFESGKRNKQDK